MTSSDRPGDGAFPLEKLPPNVFIGEGAVIRGERTFAEFRSERQPALLIGDGSLLDRVGMVVGQGGRVEIGERCRLEGVTITCETGVVIEDDVWVGEGSTIEDGVRIGRGARIGAGAVVRVDVPAGARMEGTAGARRHE